MIVAISEVVLLASRAIENLSFAPSQEVVCVTLGVPMVTSTLLVPREGSQLPVIV